MREKIKKLLIDREWTLYRLSKESKVSASTLHDFLISEKIKLLGLDKLKKIATAFKVPIEYLVVDATNVDPYEFIQDEDIRFIARSGEKMTKEQKEELKHLIERMCGDSLEKF